MSGGFCIAVQLLKNFMTEKKKGFDFKGKELHIDLGRVGEERETKIGLQFFFTVTHWPTLRQLKVQEAPVNAAVPGLTEVSQMFHKAHCVHGEQAVVAGRSMPPQ